MVFFGLSQFVKWTGRLIAVVARGLAAYGNVNELGVVMLYSLIFLTFTHIVSWLLRKISGR